MPFKSFVGKRIISVVPGKATRLEFTVALEGPFSLEYTLESGQAFRWENRGEWWYGVVPGGVLKVRQDAESLRCVSSSDSINSSFVSSYFRLDDDLAEVLESIDRDEVIREAIERFYGMRLIRQDTWECLASFSLATNANIPRITKMIDSVCRALGAATEFEGSAYRLFPTADAIRKSSLRSLRNLRLGYRAPFLKRIAENVAASGKLELSSLTSLPYEEARRILVSRTKGRKLLLGVGPKVADCVLLFSAEKDDAFPIDVWVARVLVQRYPTLLRPATRSRIMKGRGRLSAADYSAASSAARNYFGRHAGYAQQYLYMLSKTA